MVYPQQLFIRISQKLLVLRENEINFCDPRLILKQNHALFAIFKVLAIKKKKEISPTFCIQKVGRKNLI